MSAEKPAKLQDAYDLYFDKIEAINEVIQSKQGKTDAYYSLLENVKLGLTDIVNDYTEYDFGGFLSMIVRVNMIYECVSSILKKQGGVLDRTDDMLYFKFIRDTISHPDELDSNAYNKKPYQQYKKYIFVGFHQASQGIRFFGFPKYTKRLFEKEDNEFALKMDNPETGSLLMLVCPYSKIWNCLYDIIRQLVDGMS